MPATPKSNLVPSTHSCLCLDHTLGTDSSVQVLRLQETEQSCRYTRVGGGIWDVLTCSMERENCLQTEERLWDLVSSIASLVSATPHSLPPHLKLLHAAPCLALTLLPTAFQLITPYEQPVNHPCTHISLGLGEREFIPLAQLSETSSCQK